MTLMTEKQSITRLFEHENLYLPNDFVARSHERKI